VRTHLPILPTHLQLLLTVFSVFRKQKAFLPTHLQLLLTVFGVFRRQKGFLLTHFGVFRKQKGILLTHLQVLLTHFGRSRTICGNHLEKSAWRLKLHRQAASPSARICKKLLVPSLT
jgi:hypothetical protein